MKGYKLAKRTLVSREDYEPRHLRSLRHMFNAAVSAGYFGARPEGWLETMLFLGYGLTLLDQRDRVIGFSVVRPMGLNRHNEPIVYGETSLWRGEEFWDDVRYALIDGALSWGAVEIWGAHFRGNDTARRFFEEYNRMQPHELPDNVAKELARYPASEVDYLRLHL